MRCVSRVEDAGLGSRRRRRLRSILAHVSLSGRRIAVVGHPGRVADNVHNIR